MANGFIDGIGYPMNGGLAAGIRMAKERNAVDLQNWQIQEQLRKEAEAKEKEQKLGQAMNKYALAKDEDGRSNALSEMALIDPSFTQGFYKQAKGIGGFGNSELGLMMDVKMNRDKYPKEVVEFVDEYGRVKAKDPYIRGMNEYAGAVGKQYAEAGMPYGNVGQVQPEPVQSTLPSTFGLYTQEQAPQAQGMPTQAQPIPTAAQLAADKKRAEKEAEDELERKNVDIDLSKKEPVLREALEEARQALRSGVGSGVIEGYATKFGLNPFGWVDDTAENNYAAIESANKLINQYIRQSLKNSGLTGRELDSKAESERYMYNITPFDNERINERRIDNFIRDYLEGSKSLSAQPQEEIIYYEDL